MRLTFLGTGTSHGVPMIGCQCDVCTSPDPKNHRLRTCLLIQHDGTNVVIDTGPEFRLQALRARLDHLDAVLLTHAHSDHIMGLDDVRAFNMRQGTSMPVYGSPRNTWGSASSVQLRVHRRAGGWRQAENRTVSRGHSVHSRFAQDYATRRKAWAGNRHRHGIQGHRTRRRSVICLCDRYQWHSTQGDGRITGP